MSEILHGPTEKSGINRNSILLATTSFILLLILGAVAARLAFRGPIDAEIAAQPHFSISIFAKPRLQLAPSDILTALHSHEDQVLNSYGWVDKNRQTARVPIARAMELTIKKQLLSDEIKHGR
jgi:hypothetical protein